MASVAELEEEQTYFDRAAEARERTRQTLSSASAAAAGSRAAASAVNRGAKSLLDNVADADEAVSFAMFEDESGERLYLGKHAISDAERNKLVINWQADAASRYFQASYEDSCGVLRRRKFVTERNKVIDFDEVLFAELAKAVEDITEADRNGIDDSVLRDLEQDRTGEMRDIVQTIHAAQYKLIRSPLDQLLVIQGGPGTGKTAVALHRVSWLLFNHRQSLAADDVLVIGPNPTFTRYIRAVLPGLGDAEAVHRDLRSLGPISSNSRPEDVDVQRLKGSGRMAALLETALQQRVRFPAGVEIIEVGPPTRPTRLGAADVEGQLRRFLQNAPTYAAGRNGFRSWLAGEVTSEASPAQVDAAVERVWPSLTPQLFLRDLLGSRERLVAAAGDQFTAGDVSRLLRQPAGRLSEETWSDADIALVDEAAFLINGRGHTYRHVVIDEAQDLSPMQLRSARRRSRNGSMTIVGDVAQSTGPWARDTWDEVVEALQQDFPTTVEELTLGYRVPLQIYELAARLLPEAAPSITPPRIVRSGPADPTLIQCEDDQRIPHALDAARDYAGRGLFVGLVVADSMRQFLVEELRKAGIAWSDASKGDLSKSINVLSAEEAKGLEFDAVVLIEPEAIVAESDSGLRLLYVALTRSTRYLTVTYTGRLLPSKLDASAITMEEQAAIRADIAVRSTEDEATSLASPVEIEMTPAAGAASMVASRGPRAASAPDSLFEIAVVPSTDATLSQTRHVSSPTRSVDMASSNAPVVADLGRLVADTVASSIAASIRENVPVARWAYVVDRVRRELEVSSDDLLDLLTD
ncbi:ATP-binding domain-containing protein [Kribbella sp. VKM Ac-2568]|uniref:HelD family protein n=1 Tax=Kribbella sp. VKM Ac-2568 TaxID=2512219 RepID=UPI00104AEBF1|nr:ATP-binding domain-containing protein [Kribbella sp. VKM Ac-2568]TCM45227.1 DNA helicase IV [Kribbella sp. VKM Ac-2568]